MKRIIASSTNAVRYVVTYGIQFPYKESVFDTEYDAIKFANSLVVSARSNISIREERAISFNPHIAREGAIDPAKDAQFAYTTPTKTSVKDRLNKFGYCTVRDYNQVVNDGEEL